GYRPERERRPRGGGNDRRWNGKAPGIDYNKQGSPVATLPRPHAAPVAVYWRLSACSFAWDTTLNSRWLRRQPWLPCSESIHPGLRTLSNRTSSRRIRRYQLSRIKI